MTEVNKSSPLLKVQVHNKTSNSPSSESDEMEKLQFSESDEENLKDEFNQTKTKKNEKDDTALNAISESEAKSIINQSKSLVNTIKENPSDNEKLKMDDIDEFLSELDSAIMNSPIKHGSDKNGGKNSEQIKDENTSKKSELVVKDAVNEEKKLVSCESALESVQDISDDEDIIFLPCKKDNKFPMSPTKKENKSIEEGLVIEDDDDDVIFCDEIKTDVCSKKSVPLHNLSLTKENNTSDNKAARTDELTNFLQKSKNNDESGDKETEILESINLTNDLDTIQNKTSEPESILILNENEKEDKIKSYKESNETEIDKNKEEHKLEKIEDDSNLEKLEKLDNEKIPSRSLQRNESNEKSEDEQNLNNTNNKTCKLDSIEIDDCIIENKKKNILEINLDETETNQETSILIKDDVSESLVSNKDNVDNKLDLLNQNKLKEINALESGSNIKHSKVVGYEKIDSTNDTVKIYEDCETQPPLKKLRLSAYEAPENITEINNSQLPIRNKTEVDKPIDKIEKNVTKQSTLDNIHKVNEEIPSETVENQNIISNKSNENNKIESDYRLPFSEKNLEDVEVQEKKNENEKKVDKLSKLSELMESKSKEINFSSKQQIEDCPSKSTLANVELVSNQTTVAQNDDVIVVIDENKEIAVGKSALKRTNDEEDCFEKKIKLDDIISENLEKNSLKHEENKRSLKPDLYPAPKLLKNGDINMEFLKRFKKSLNSISRNDLELFVTQKVVESIIYTSEFGQMRDHIEKQEQLIETFRKKIADLIKQFKDLKMVHDRVIKDLETRNQQFIMPVKITRAVGLQVVMPMKPQQINKVSGPLGSDSQKNNMQNNISQLQSETLPKIPQQQQLVMQQRGRSHQKFTPLRPDTPQNSSLQRNVSASSNSANCSNTLQQVATNNFAQIINAENLTQHEKFKQQQKSGLIQKQMQHVQQQSKKVAGVRQQQLQNLPQQNLLVVKNTSGPTIKKLTAPNSNKTRLTSGNPIYQQQSSQTQLQQILVRKSTSATLQTSHKSNQSLAQPIAVVPSAKSQQIQQSSNLQAKSKPVIDLTDEDDGPTRPDLSPILKQAPTLVAIPAQNSAKPTSILDKQTQKMQQQTVVQHRMISQLVNRPNKVVVQQSNTRQVTQTSRIMPPTQQRLPNRFYHPAPLPRQPVMSTNSTWKEIPPRPLIQINNIETGIVISWTMDDLNENRHAEVSSYQIYAYQETLSPPSTESWRHVGDVKAMLLPMAVTLTQFQEGQRYHFAVRAVDTHNRYGQFSLPKTW